MNGFVLKRVAVGIPQLVFLVVCVSLLLHLIPGSPVDLLLGDYASDEERGRLATQLGLDLPWPTYVARFFADLARGNLGTSLFSGEDITWEMAARLPITAGLAAASLVVAAFLGILIGMLAAAFAGTWIDALLVTLSLAWVAMPNFLLGPLLILVFSLWLDWLPVTDLSSPLGYLLPVLTVGGSLAGATARLTRESVLEIAKSDFVRTARAKGVAIPGLWLRHILRPALIPVLSILGLQLGALMSGSVITEKIFNIPGLGTYMMDALNARDYPVIRACVLLFGAFHLLINLATDLLYSAVDPRIRLETATR